MVKKPKQYRNQKKLILISAAAVIVIVGGLLIFRHFHNSSGVTTPEGVKLTPATSEERQQSEQNKDNIVQQQQSTSQNNTTPSDSSTPTAKKTVSVFITSANASSVRAYVTGVFEDGGTCTATFTQGSTVVTHTSTGFGNVSDTQCPPITPNLPSGGSWSVTVSYSSATSTGVSQAQTF